MQFLKGIFLPEKIKNYYLFPSRVVGIEITKNEIFATVLYSSGTTITIESFVTQELPQAETFQQRVQLGLELLVQIIGAQKVNIAVDSSHVFFKRLHLPFSDYEKLKMVINFEIQPLLPFASSDAAIDFIITHTSASEGSDLFVTAAQKTPLVDQAQIINTAGLRSNIYVPDMVALYLLFKQLPESAITQAVVLLDFGAHQTRLAYIFDGQLLFIRTLAKGFVDIARATAKHLGNNNTGTIIEHLHRFGFERNSDFATEQSLKQHMDAFMKEVAFTFASFTAQTITASHIKKIILSGEGSLFKGIESCITKELTITCEKFKYNELLHTKHIALKQTQGTIPETHGISLATALAPFVAPEYNLLPEFIQASEANRTTYSLIISCILAIALLSTLTVSNYLQTRSFSNQAEETATELVETLKNIPGVTETEEEADNTIEDRLELLLNRARTRISEREKLVNEFSTRNRQSFLQYLYEFAQLDRSALGLTIEELSITQDRIIFKGNVKTFAAATTLRQALRDSEFFGPPTPAAELDKTVFNVQIPIISGKTRSRT